MYRAISRALNRAIAPCAPMVELICRKQIIRKSTTLCRRHAAVFIGSRKLGDASSHRELCSQQKPNINHIKNAFCSELTVEDIGNFVQLRGVAMHIRKGNYLVIKDKTGSAKLVVDKDRKDLMDWLQKLEKYSFIMIIGMVKEKHEVKATGNDMGEREEFDVVVNYVISSMPPNAGRTSEEQQRKLTEELFSPSPAPGKNVTCDKITKEEIGKTFQVFGWVDRIDNEEKSFILRDAHGFIKVVPDIMNDFHEVNKLEIGDIVVVEGTAGQSPILLMGNIKSSKSRGDELQIVANFVKKLNEEDSLGLRAPDVNRYTVRTHNCGELNASHAGQNVRLMGWVAYIRVDKFIVLQDKYGLVQLTTSHMKNSMISLKDCPLESVISVEGIVCLRPPGNENKAMKTGEIEVAITDLVVVNQTEMLPFYHKDPRPARPTQLEYKYLDIRQYPPSMMNLEFRCQILHKMRRFLIEKVGFVEVETPTLFSRTPGGAQEFVVPTRRKGEYYALVQSPQQFKQMLMIGGLDRYFQMARCYRDEVSKKDRQPEFTQLDIEMSFCNLEGVIQLVEDIVKFVWPQHFTPLRFPFPRMTYEQAMTSYGTDKPDTRFEWKITDVTDIFKTAGKSCSEKIDMEKYMSSEDFTALTLVAKGGQSAFLSLKQLAEEQALETDCKVFSFKLDTRDKFHTNLNKLFVQPIPKDVTKRLKYDVKDVVYLGFGQRKKMQKLFGALRRLSAKIVEEHGVHVFDKKQPSNFLWIVDFPLFEEVDGVIQSVHHPFTQPHPEDLELLDTHPLKVRGLNYDLVLDGNEIGGGSIRIHDSKLQEKILCDILKLDKSYFKHLLKALTHGAPVHGGFALGIDRFISLLRGTQSISDVIAFPKYSTGRDAISGAPSDIPEADKDLYHLS